MSRQSILTKYIGPTDTTGSRIKAVQSGWVNDKTTNSITIGYEHALNSDENHAKAALQLARKLGWDNQRFVCASLGKYSEFSYCFAIDDGDAFACLEGK